MTDFIQQPYPSWIFDNSLNRWIAPVPYPDDWQAYVWNEKDQIWTLWKAQNT